MKIFEDITISHSIEINAPAQRIYDFFLRLHETDNYRTWHPADHISFQWTRGVPWHEGSKIYAEEIMHGKKHQLKFTVLRNVNNTYLEYAPSNPIVRFFFPKNTFEITPTDTGCTFKATGCFRLGILARKFSGKNIEIGINSIKKHIAEEGENLKKIIEAHSNK